MARRISDVKKSKPYTENKDTKSYAGLEFLGCVLYIIALVFGFGIFYLFCFGTGTKHIKVSLLSLPGLLIAPLFKSNPEVPIIITIASFVGGYCIFEYVNKKKKK